MDIGRLVQGVAVEYVLLGSGGRDQEPNLPADLITRKKDKNMKGQAGKDALWKMYTREV